MQHRLRTLFWGQTQFRSCGVFWLCWVFVAVRGLSLVVVRGLLSVVASLVEEHRLQALVLEQLRHSGSRAHRLQQLQLAGSRAQAQELWRTGLVASRHVESSQTRARTRVPALAGGFLTTVPPGKSLVQILILSIINCVTLSNPSAPVSSIVSKSGGKNTHFHGWEGKMREGKLMLRTKCGFLFILFLNITLCTPNRTQGCSCYLLVQAA